MEELTEQHMLAVKRILRYVKGTTVFGIRYMREGNTKLFGFVDSDYAGDMDDMKSTSEFVFMLGDGTVAWVSKK